MSHPPTTDPGLTTTQSPHAGAVPLYLAAFFMGFSGIWWAALPYIIKRFGGTGADVGVCFGLSTGSYMLTCALCRTVFDRFNPKRIVQMGAGGTLLVMVTITLIVAFSTEGVADRRLILMLDATAILTGFASAAFWPPLMAWILRNYHGTFLNRRMGVFNTAWSLGGLLAPLLGGYLVEINAVSPLIATSVVLAVCFLTVLLARCPGKAAPTDPADEPQEVKTERLHPRGPAFRWMSRIALVAVFVPVALFLTQGALLVKFKLGFTESTFGLLVMIKAASQTIMFAIVGRTRVWQYKLTPFIACQLILLASMLIAIWGTSLAGLVLAAVLLGVGIGFTYSSHLYYGLAESSKRDRVTSLHETLLSIGLVFGSFAGGWISDHWSNPRFPYVFGAGVIVIALIIQAIIWFAMARRRTNQNS